MKQFWLVAAAAVLLTTLLPDGAFAQRGGFRGAAIGGGFRGAAMMSGGFRGAPIGGAFRTASIGGFRGVGPGVARIGPGFRAAAVAPGIARVGPGFSSSRHWSRLPWCPCRGLPRRRLGARMALAERVGLGLARCLWARRWRGVGLSLLRFVLLRFLHRLVMRASTSVHMSTTEPV